MTINYDTVADAIYFTVKDGKVSKTLPISQHLNVDVDAEGHTVGIELLSVSSQQGAALKESIMNGVPVEIISKTPITA